MAFIIFYICNNVLIIKKLPNNLIIHHSMSLNNLYLLSTNRPIIIIIYITQLYIFFIITIINWENQVDFYMENNK